MDDTRKIAMEYAKDIFTSICNGNITDISSGKFIGNFFNELTDTIYNHIKEKEKE